jgi:hypothetical protein
MGDGDAGVGIYSAQKPAFSTQPARFLRRKSRDHSVAAADADC